MAETVKLGEPIEKALQRGIKEELKVDPPFKMKFKELYQKIAGSPSYPGLITEYTIYCFEVIFSDEHYKKAGYREVEKYITTYFVWEEI